MHAALGDPVRLAIVDELTEADLAPSELSRRLSLGSNLLAHHLDVLERSGLIDRRTSAADRRRRYVRLEHAAMAVLSRPAPTGPPDEALFVCTHNRARSQLAAAVWRSMTGGRASSAGTRPAAAVHPGAVAAAARAGIDLGPARPRPLDEKAPVPSLVITVCDAAHEAVGAARGWRHWSLPDPVADGRASAFDATVAALRSRISSAFAVVAP